MIWSFLCFSFLLPKVWLSLASHQSLLEMQVLRPYWALLNQNLHYNETAKKLVCTFQFEKQGHNLLLHARKWSHLRLLLLTSAWGWGSLICLEPFNQSLFSSSMPKHQSMEFLSLRTYLDKNLPRPGVFQALANVYSSYAFPRNP